MTARENDPALQVDPNYAAADHFMQARQGGDKGAWVFSLGLIPWSQNAKGDVYLKRAACSLKMNGIWQRDIDGIDLLIVKNRKFDEFHSPPRILERYFSFAPPTHSTVMPHIRGDLCMLAR